MIRHIAHIVCGSPASGKSTLAAKIAAEHSAALLDIDTVTGRLVENSLALLQRDASERDVPFFKDNFREPIYEALFDIAAANLEFVDVVIVGPFTRELSDPDWPAKLKARLNAEVEIHYVYCAPDKRRERMISRASPRDKSKLADWEKYIKYYGQELRPPFPHKFVDTSAD